MPELCNTKAGNQNALAINLQNSCKLLGQSDFYFEFIFTTYNFAGQTSLLSLVCHYIRFIGFALQVLQLCITSILSARFENINVQFTSPLNATIVMQKTFYEKTFLFN